MLSVATGSSFQGIKQDRGSLDRSFHDCEVQFILVFEVMVNVGLAGVCETRDGAHRDGIKTLLGKQAFGGDQYGLLAT